MADIPQFIPFDAQGAKPQSNISSEMRGRIEHLPKEIQGKAVVLEPGKTLFRKDQRAKEIIASGAFDLEKTHFNALHFIDAPAEGVNLSVILSKELLVANLRNENERKLDASVLEQLSNINPDIEIALKQLGFEGFLGAGSSMHVPENVQEIVIFPEGTHAFGTIQHYEDISIVGDTIRDMLK